MIDFKSLGVYTIVGRGIVFIVQPSENVAFDQVFKNFVGIDGNTYYCTGVERQPKHRPDHALLYAGENIGILTSLESISESHKEG